MIGQVLKAGWNSALALSASLSQAPARPESQIVWCHALSFRATIWDKRQHAQPWTLQPSFIVRNVEVSGRLLDIRGAWGQRPIMAESTETQNASQEMYVETPLLEPTSIRLLELIAFDEATMSLRFRMRAMPLGEKPFRALSYT